MSDSRGMNERKWQRGERLTTVDSSVETQWVLLLYSQHSQPC